MPANRLNLAYSPDKGPVFPFSSTVGIPQINIFSAAPWQIGALQFKTVNLVYPGWTGFQDQKFAFALSSFPPSITLPKGASGVIFVSSSLANPLPAGILVSVPTIQLVIGKGSAANQLGAEAGNFALQPGRTYSSISVAGLVRAYAPGGTAQITISLSVWVMLLGHS